MEFILDRNLDLVINIPLPNNGGETRHIYEDEYLIRRKATEFNIPVITNLQLAEELVESIEYFHRNNIMNMEDYHSFVVIKSLDEYHEYLKQVYW